MSENQPLDPTTPPPGTSEINPAQATPPPAEPIPDSAEPAISATPVASRSTRRPLSHGQIAALLLMIFSFLASAVISRNVFERMPHLEDEFAYLWQAKVFARGQLWAERPEGVAVKVFWQPFIIQPDTPTDGVLKRFAKYPPGWPMVLAPGVALGMPWLVNAVLGMLSIGLVYRLGKEIFDEAVGLVAALLLAISPMALLLNATLMNHTWTMFATIVFVYAYWRTVKHGRGRFVWAAVGGLMIGAVVPTRPLSAVAMATPAALHALSRLLDMLGDKREADQKGRTGFWPTLRVLLVLSVFTVPTAALWPLFNHIWTGDWRTNTYTLQWPYDKVGFGPGYGLNPGGHSLKYGWRNMRADIPAWFRDLYGWTMPTGMEAYLRESFTWGAGAGLSWIPIVLGLYYGRKREWVWLFLMLFGLIIFAGLLYWIGSVVNGAAAYSVRYYYEATFAVCLVSGYGIVAWQRAMRANRQAKASIYAAGTPVITDFSSRLRLAWDAMWPGYFLLLAACGLSLGGYTPDRFRQPLPGANRSVWANGLYGYNMVSRAKLDQIAAMRQGDPRPLMLVILERERNTDEWRQYAAAMSVTSPFLDSDIIVARVFVPEESPEIERRFPGRLVLYQVQGQLYRTIEEAMAGS